VGETRWRGEALEGVAWVQISSEALESVAWVRISGEGGFRRKPVQNVVSAIACTNEERYITND
jgi:hypothetical protein